ncbi:MAG: dihydropteroate synthase [Spirochaetaceae bacterium]|jgi:dihydropteroate synthase|nr:dihydropteroate synthase [Spirochaetaceae bacterium]
MLDFSTPRIMGILNCTPDSFYAQSRVNSSDSPWLQAKSLIDQGAYILDIGGESSRPGSSYVSAQEEMDRVLPVIEGIRRESDIPLSLDTRKSSVAKEALKLGIQMINDISGLRDDEQLAQLAAEHDCYLVLMHMRGTPETMQKNPCYEDLLVDLKRELMVSTDKALAAGVSADKIILDPGIGFGKTQEHNRQILRDIPKIKQWGYAVLIGLSRKSYIGNILNLPPEKRLFGSLTADIYAIMQGASIIRVHDVEPHVQALKVLKDLLWTG